jgi:dolichol-phosphate mannosyltransferase
MRPLIVIPTFNEALNIEQLIAKLLALEPAVNVLVADDASPDGTGVLVDRLAHEHPDRVFALHRDAKGGRGAAVLAGLAQGALDDRYDRFVEMDADLSHLPEELPALLAASESADVVVGSRYGHGSRILGWSRRRKLWSRMSNRIINTVLRLPIGDYTNGYRVYKRSAVEHLLAADLRERGYISLSEWACVLHRSGMTFVDVPTTFVNRRLGVSKMSAGEATEALRALLRMRRQLTH